MFLLTKPMHLFALVIILFMWGLQSKGSIMTNARYLPFSTCAKTWFVLCVEYFKWICRYVASHDVIYWGIELHIPFSAHMCSSSNSFSKLIWSWTNLIALYNRQSSANSLTFEDTYFEMSLMYKMHNNGQSIVPCWTPVSTWVNE